MKNIYIYLLLFLRKVYLRFFYQSHRVNNVLSDIDSSNSLIYNELNTGGGKMIARFGSIELDNISNYIGRTRYGKNPIRFIMNRQPAWWFQKDRALALCSNAGFFPQNREDLLERYCKLNIKDAKYVDVLGSWQDNEKYLDLELRYCKKVVLSSLEPFFAKIPWTRVLEGKKVLVVHPFADTIMKQYNKREYLFSNPLVLPVFGSLSIIKAVQSIGGKSDQFDTWFDALEYMKTEIDKIDFDICLLGCGAYGFPLAAHIKRRGKKAVHLGGALQLLFGIEGNRWFDPKSELYPIYKELKNSFWTKPSESEKPQTASLVEGACYW